MPLILFCVFEALFAPVSVGGRRDKAHWGLGCWVDAGDVVLSQFGLCVELLFLLGGVCVCVCVCVEGGKPSDVRFILIDGSLSHYHIITKPLQALSPSPACHHFPHPP